ncbi:LuxR C-terminal-related transcriptional regulator [Aliagarivorans marinus]|uniref:LuxR C-terminal-related transcriptional regulator n=1 Tax=Aliagarivorans marinus TaxID=561965 RepID=UPI00041BD33F|nr:LuxR family transcriptional regulator [Aliagarivorans marinus]
MDTEQYPIASFKISIPHVHGKLLPRPQLPDPFSLPIPVWALVAPAGFGKTSLALSWTQQNDRQAVWYSLDETDNDPGRFFSHLFAALQAQGVEQLSLAPSLLHTPQLFLSHILAQLKLSCRPLLIVLDDFHVIEEEGIHSLLQQLMSHLPVHVRLVLTSRSLPPLGIAKLKAKGLAMTLGAQMLRFSREETADWFRCCLGSPQSEGNTEQLWEKSPGWPGGLRLLSMSTHAVGMMTISDLQSHDQTLLQHYLTDEVYSHLSSQLQEFLQLTCVLEWFDIELAQSLSESAQASEMIVYLEANGLLIRQSSQPLCYRYLSLFREFLLTRLSACPRRYQQAHQRACELLAVRARTSEALHLAMQMRSRESVIACLLKHGDAMILQGQSRNVQQGLSRLRFDELSAHPQLLLMQIRCALYRYDMESLSDWLPEVEPFLEQHAQSELAQDPNMQAELAIARAHIAIKREHWQLADRYLRDLSCDNQRIQMQIYSLRGEYTLAMGQPEQALVLLNDALRLANEQQAYVLVLWLLGLMAEAEMHTLKLASAKARLTMAKSLAKSHHLEGLRIMEFVYRCHFKLALLSDDVAAAQRDLQATEALIGGLNGKWQLPLLMEQLHLALRHRQWLDVQQLGVRLDSLLSGLAVHREWTINAETLLLSVWFQQRDDARIRRWLLDHANSESIGNHYLLQHGINKLRALLILNKPRTALRLSETLLESAEPQQRLASLSIALFRCLANQRLQRSQTQLQMHRALQLVGDTQAWGLLLEPDGSFIETLRELDIGDSPVANQILQRSQTNRDVSAKRPSLLVHCPPAATQLGVSHREWKVLTHIANGKTNEQIAESLFIAHSTVKSHIRRIYRKLEVSERQQAIQAALRLQL